MTGLPGVELAPGVRRLIAPNPSLMTGPGTNTYLLGHDAIAVVDPGPDIASHIDDILQSAGAAVRWILATHTHPDHSPGVAALAAATGAEVLGLPAPDGAHQDATFLPTRIFGDGERVAVGALTLSAVHTPGHASNHLCFLVEPLNWILTGDHVIDGSTVVIDPPDGNMRHYLESLARLRELAPAALLPGHGNLIDEPARVIDGIIAHRLARERKVLAAVCGEPGLAAVALVARVYDDVPVKLHAWAMRSLLAHLIKLEGDGDIVRTGEAWRPRP